MDYKIVFLLAMIATCALCLPSQPSCACTRMYYPICDSDLHTSNNMCEFKCREAHMRKHGHPLTILEEGITCDDFKLNNKPYGVYAPIYFTTPYTVCGPFTTTSIYTTPPWDQLACSCTMQYNPVCITDWGQYYNFCYDPCRNKYLKKYHYHTISSFHCLTGKPITAADS